jgi:hypothetical protein
VVCSRHCRQSTSRNTVICDTHRPNSPSVHPVHPVHSVYSAGSSSFQWPRPGGSEMTTCHSAAPRGRLEPLANYFGAFDVIIVPGNLPPEWRGGRSPGLCYSTSPPTKCKIKQTFPSRFGSDGADEGLT